MGTKLESFRPLYAELLNIWDPSSPVLDKIHVLLFRPGFKQVITASKNVGWTKWYDDDLDRPSPPEEGIDEEEEKLEREARIKKDAENRAKEEKQREREMRVIMEFEPKLEEGVKKGEDVLAHVRKTFCGWEDATDLRSAQQAAQLLNAMLTLPLEHPAFKAYMSQASTR